MSDYPTSRPSLYKKLPKDKLYGWSKVHKSKKRLNNYGDLLRYLLNNSLEFVTTEVVDDNTNWDRLPCNTAYYVVAWEGTDAPSNRLFADNNGLVLTLGSSDRSIYQIAFNPANLAVRNRKPGANWTYMSEISINRMHKIYSTVAGMADKIRQSVNDVDNERNLIMAGNESAINHINRSAAAINSTISNFKDYANSVSNAANTNAESLAVIAMNQANEYANVKINRLENEIKALKAKINK